MEGSGSYSIKGVVVVAEIGTKEAESLDIHVVHTELGEKLVVGVGAFSKIGELEIEEVC